MENPWVETILVALVVVQLTVAESPDLNVAKVAGATGVTVRVTLGGGMVILIDLLVVPPKSEAVRVYTFGVLAISVRVPLGEATPPASVSVRLRACKVCQAKLRSWPTS